MRATTTSKGQITIPKKVRERLNLEPGDVLVFDESAPYLVARAAFDEAGMRDALSCARGALGMASSEWLEETRGKVVDASERA